MLSPGSRPKGPFKAIHSYIRQFIPRIIEAKEELQQLNLTLDLGTERRSYFANRSFSREVDELNNVKTVFFNVSKKMYLSALPPKWFDPHSSDCGKMSLYAKGYRAWRTQKCLTNSTYTYINIQSQNISSRKSRVIFRRGEIKNTATDLNTLTVGYVHVIKDGILLPIGDVITTGAHISIRGCPRSEADNNFSTKVRKSRIYKEIFSLAQIHGSNFYHFTAEDLSRLILFLPFLRQNKNVKIHVRHTQSFVRTFLKRLGLSEWRIVAGLVRGHIVYLPGGTDCGRPAPFQTNLLSLYLSQSLQTMPQTSIILIRRSKKRWFEHHDSILKMLQEVAKDFRLSVEVFSDKSLPGHDATAHMFSRAVLVVAPHGAGLANLIFSKPNTCVVEGLCYGDDGKVNLCYRDLSAILGHVYHGVVTSGQCMKMTADNFRPQVVQCLKHVLQ